MPHPNFRAHPDRAGPSTRSASVESAPPDDPCATFFLFYGGVINVGVDPEGRFVGVIVRGDLHPDEPLFVPGTDGKFARRREFRDMPLHLLLDEAERIVGVHVFGHKRATRVCDLNPGLVSPEERRALDALRVSVPYGRWPENEEEFASLMEHLDEQVRHLPVPLRPLHALPIASKLLDKPVPFFGQSGAPRTGVYSGEDFAIRLSKWFESRYGDRLKVSMSPGSFVVRLRGTLWECPIYRFYGAWEFFCSRTEPTQRREAGSAANRSRYNILDAVRDLPEATRFQLGDAELMAFVTRYRAAQDTFRCLGDVADHAFTTPVFGDFAACVRHLMGDHPQFGQARWSALQAAEKLTKLALDVAGGTVPKVHDMAMLNAELSRLGYPVLPPPVVAALTFKAAVRYGEVPTTLDEAVAAHDAAFDVGALLGREIIQRRPSPPKPWLAQ
jgi:hypothetical protein